jgi:hypothetical protein
LSIELDLKRFENFRDSEFKNIEIKSPTEISLSFALQDSAREFDWIVLELVFSGVSDARLIDTDKLAFIDMSDGITILKDDQSIAFGISECYNIKSIKTSVCYIIASSLKYYEKKFEG